MWSRVCRRRRVASAWLGVLAWRALPSETGRLLASTNARCSVTLVGCVDGRSSCVEARGAGEGVLLEDSFSVGVRCDTWRCVRTRLCGVGDDCLGRALLQRGRAERAREEEGAAKCCVVRGLALADSNGVSRGGVLQHRIASRQELGVCHAFTVDVPLLRPIRSLFAFQGLHTSQVESGFCGRT